MNILLPCNVVFTHVLAALSIFPVNTKDKISKFVIR